VAEGGGPVSGYQYDAYLREGITLVVAHCVDEDWLADFSNAMWIDERQAAAAALLELRSCRPLGGSWTWTEVPGSGLRSACSATLKMPTSRAVSGADKSDVASHLPRVGVGRHRADG
jgi:hypothetical protein